MCKEDKHKLAYKLLVEQHKIKHVIFGQKKNKCKFFMMYLKKV